MKHTVWLVHSRQRKLLSYSYNVWFRVCLFRLFFFDQVIVFILAKCYIRIWTLNCPRNLFRFMPIKHCLTLNETLINVLTLNIIICIKRMQFIKGHVFNIQLRLFVIMGIYGEFFLWLVQTQVEEPKTPRFISDPLKKHNFFTRESRIQTSLYNKYKRK